MSNAIKLYELSAAMNQVAAMIEDGAEGLEDTLDALECSFEDKIESILKLWRSKCATRDIIKSEIYRLQQLSDKLDKDANWLHGYVEREMMRANKTEVKSALFGIKLGMTPPRVEVDNMDGLPAQYLRVVTSKTPDKLAIKEAMQRGEIVPGCRLEQDLKLKVR